MKEDKKDPVNRIVIGLVIGGIATTLLFTILFMGYVEHPIFSTDKIDPEIFGQYGDVLGGVIGTVLGFLSVYLLFLTYQTQKIELAETKEVLRDQKQKEEFELYFKLIDDIKLDVNSLRYSDQVGMGVLKFLINDLSLNSGTRIRGGNLNYILNIVGNLVLQFEFLIDYINNFESGTDRQREVLISKLSITYSSYLLELISTVKKYPIPEEEIYTSCRTLLIELQEEMKPFYRQQVD